MGLTKPRAHQLQDIDYKQTARAVTTSNITLSGGAPATVDGVSLALRDRVLVTGQSTGSENGIYYVTTVGAGSNGTWARSLDADATGEVSAGMIIMVTEGTTYADTQWKLTTDDPITIGSTSLTFVRNGNAAYGTVAVSGEDSIVADAIGDTLTLVAGTNLALTTNASTDTLTITPSLTPSLTTVTATGNITGGNLVTSGTVTMDRLSLTSSQTTVPPLQLTADNLNDNVGSLRIDGSQPDIYLNQNGVSFTTVTFARQISTNAQPMVGFGKDSGDNLYFFRETAQDVANTTVYDNTSFVMNRGSGNISMAHNLAVTGEISYGTLTGGNITTAGTGTFGTMTDGTVSFTSGNISGVDELRIDQSGTGLRMTNVGAFDNDGSDNFRIFATNDLKISANGQNGTAITIDATNQDVTITNDLRVDAGNLYIGGTAVTATATELNLLDGVTGLTLGTANEILIIGSDNTSIEGTDILTIDTASNYVGINQTSPEVTLHMTGEGAQTAQIRMEQYNDSADAPDVRTRRYRGTIASPSAVQSGDYLFRSNHEYWNGTSLLIGGAFAFDNTNNAARTQFSVAVDTDGTGANPEGNNGQFKIDGNDGGAITFNNAYKFPTTDGTADQVLVTDGAGTLSFADASGGGATVSSDTSTNSNFLLYFASTTTGALTAVKQDSGLTYNPSTGLLTSAAFSGSGASLTALNGSNISTGTVAAARVATLNQNTTGTAGGLSSAVTVSLSGDVTGSATFTNAGDTASITTTIAANSVALGTDTTGNYVGTITGGTGINSSGATSGEGVAHTLSIDSTVATLTGSQTLTNKTLTSPVISSISNSGTLTLPTSTGTIALTSDIPTNNNQLTNGAGYTTNVGDITGVTAGVGLSGGGSSGSVTLTVDLSELTDMTGGMVGTDEFIVLDAGADRRKAANEIGLSIFNNDAGFTTNTGDITNVSVSGTGLSGGGASGSVTITSNATSANTGSTIVARDGSGNFSAGVITATATQARYADLAEKYTSDQDYEPGTVVELGGEYEVTQTRRSRSTAIAGVVSTDPAYLMNNDLDGISVALIGRVPCKVVGTVRKGDMLISSDEPGHAQSYKDIHNPPTGSVIGKAIENKDNDGPGVIEVLVGRL